MAETIFCLPMYHLIPDTWYFALVMFIFGFGWYFLLHYIWIKLAETNKPSIDYEAEKRKKMADKTRELKGKTFYDADGKPIILQKK